MNIIYNERVFQLLLKTKNPNFFIFVLSRDMSVDLWGPTL